MSLSLGRSTGGESIYWVYLNLLLLVAVWPPVACYYLTFYFKLTFCVTEHRRDKQLSLQQHCQAVGVMPSMGLIFVFKTDEWMIFLLALLGADTENRILKMSQTIKWDLADHVYWHGPFSLSIFALLSHLAAKTMILCSQVKCCRTLMCIFNDLIKPRQLDSSCKMKLGNAYHIIWSYVATV